MMPGGFYFAGSEYSNPAPTDERFLYVWPMLQYAYWDLMIERERTYKEWLENNCAKNTFTITHAKGYRGMGDVQRMVGVYFDVPEDKLAFKLTFGIP